MGKAAERRKASRLRYLATLALANPDRFRSEWDKRMDSWLHEIRRRAGILVDNHGETMPPAFDVIKEAERLLHASGLRKDDLEEHRSINILVNECCKVLASHIDNRLYYLSPKIQRK